MRKIFFMIALFSASATMIFAQTPTTAAPTPTVPANQVKSLYSDAYTFAPASLLSYNEGWWDWPTLTEETIGEDHYLHYNGRMTGMIGWMFGDISVATMEFLHVDIWPSENTSIKMGPTSPHSPDNAVASITLTVEAGKWNSFDIPVDQLKAANPDFTLNDVFQNQFTEYAALTDLCVDNVYFYTTVAPAEDKDAPTAFTAVLESASFFSLNIKANATDASGSVNYSVINGELIVASGMGASGEDAIITVPGLAPNTEYSFKVVAKDESGNATEPVAVSGMTLATPAAAPAPTVAADKVKSIYSDAYEAAIAVEEFRQNWWNGAELVQGKLSENDNVLYYTATTDGGAHGWQLTGQLDATGFNKLHISIYPLNAGTFTNYPVVDGQDEKAYYRTSEALVANQWNEVVFDFAELALDKVKQLGWNGYFALGSFFMDNVYFFAEEEQGVEDINAGVKAQKVIENGQLIIIKNGARYNAFGAQVQ